jgi:CheY-like chemotaxis protein
MAETSPLDGRRVLVVEDEMMIAMLVEDMLGELGCVVVGPVNTLADALELAGSATVFDAALLDVNLAGQPVFPVADAVRAKGVPAIFSTGYGDAGLREVDRGAQVLQKPFRVGDLARALTAALGAPQGT